MKRKTSKRTIGEYKCPVCGKIFYCFHFDQWVYKKQWYSKVYVLCSWKCYRIKEAEMEKIVSKRGRKKRKEA